jgi:hypothetical protein
MDRRDFVAAGLAPLFVPRRAFGANDRIIYGLIAYGLIAYGLIATGGRGRYLNRIFQKMGAQIHYLREWAARCRFTASTYRTPASLINCCSRRPFSRAISIFGATSSGM